MFDSFTDRARRIVSNARDRATRLGTISKWTVELLAAMWAEQHGVAGNILRRHGVHFASNEIATEMADAPDVTYAEVEAAAVSAANWLGHHYPGTEHLLLGLCNLPQAHAHSVLRAFDVSPVALCRDTLDVLGRHTDWDRWREEHGSMAE